jgi:hypothetical protein
MDKPAVAKKIVKAIRDGNPPGRFLKKCDDGLWYDVGDRNAAEKTSQGLRERTNSEKRERSVLREALRFKKSDCADEDAFGVTSGNNQHTDTSLVDAESKPPRGEAATRYAKANTHFKGDSNASSSLPGINSADLPPNAVDKHGNILVTDYDILVSLVDFYNYLESLH